MNQATTLEAMHRPWRQQRKTHKWQPLLVLLVIAPLTGSCVEAPGSRTMPSMLDVHGTGARIASQEWQFLLWTGVAVQALIVILLGAILVRHVQRRRSQADHMSHADGLHWIWWGGIALPLVLLPISFVVTIQNSLALSAAPSPETVTINVTGHQWWWEVRYADEDFALANHIYVPVGQAVRINLTTEDVIHSFWVPQLHFKVDLMPGQQNSTWLRAEEAGVYRGLCAEYCGRQHAQMMFMVVALPPDEFQAWLAHERLPAPPPASDLAQAGQALFLSKNCLYCHTVRGTPAAGEQGPELTHLASRLIIAAGALENNVGNLGGWIMDPQHVKPGSEMPATPLTGEELQALLAFLTGLQ